MLHSSTASLLEIPDAFVAHIPHLLRTWPQSFQIYSLACVYPQTVQKYVELGNDVDGPTDVSFAGSCIAYIRIYRDCYGV